MAHAAPRQARPTPPGAAGEVALSYGLLVAILAAAVLGNQTLLFLDPITMTRTLGCGLARRARRHLLAEASLYQFPFLWDGLMLHTPLFTPLPGRGFRLRAGRAFSCSSSPSWG